MAETFVDAELAPNDGGRGRAGDISGRARGSRPCADHGALSADPPSSESHRYAQQFKCAYGGTPCC